ncbi:hypothetical protein [Streptomyces sp. NPDC126499]|uniref:hypothetical protein n=1 Tax=Streptomyces sp. NPDC126499 TaxID=3155314 RepID=UPI00331A8B46
MLRWTPEEFGAVGCVVLGADAVQVSADTAATRSFGMALQLFGVECVDGFQRAVIIARTMAERGREHLARSTVRVEIHTGPGRETARRLHDEAGALVNAPKAQDGLVRCPNIARLMAADWEGMGSFEPRRGVVVGPHGDLFTMPVVTRALACLADSPAPDAVHLACTEEGLESFWGQIGSPLYLSVFHERMIPLGVKRAVEAWRRVHEVLADLPSSRKQGPGHLIRYAPDLICWLACHDVFPLDQLHQAKSTFDWYGTIRDRLPAVTVRRACELVERYGALRKARGSKGNYVDEVVRYDVWRDILAMGR